MRNRAKATVEITAEDKTARALKAMERKFQSTAKKLQSTGRAMTAAVTLPAVIFGASAFNQFREFEAEMAKVAAVSGAAGDELKALEQNAKELGAATKFSAGEVAGLQLEYSKLGFSAKEITNVTKATLALAQASDSDLAQSAAVAGSTLRAFGIEATDTARITDVMAASFSSSALDLDKFQESMKLVAPISKSAGISLEETTGLLATLADNGISGSMAGTALRRILNDLSKDGRPLNDVLQELGDSNIDLASAEKLVGKNAQSALLILAKNAKRAKELTKEYENAEGTASKMAAIMDDTASGALARLGSAFSALQIQVGGIIAKALVPMVDKIGPVLAKFGEMDDGIQLAVVAVAGLAAVLGPILILLGSLVSGIGAVASVVGAVSFAPIILGVVAVGGVLAVLVRYWEQVKQAAMKFASFVVDAFNSWKDRNAETLAKIGAAWESIKDSSIRIFTAVVAKIQEVIAKLDEFLQPIGGLQGAWEIFGQVVAKQWDIITSVIGGAFDIIASIFSNLADVLEGNKSAWEGFKDVIKTVLIATKNLFFEIFGEVVSYLKTLPSIMLGLGRNMIDGLLQGLKDKASGAVDFVKEIGNDIKDGFASALEIFSPSRVFRGYGRNITAGLVLGMASGGNAVGAQAEMMAQKVLAGYQQGIGPGLQGPDFSSALGGIGGGFGFDAAPLPGNAELQAVEREHAQKMSLLKKYGLEETQAAKAQEYEKQSALYEIRQMQIAGTGQAFDSIIQLTQAFGGKQSGILKGLFAVSKGFAVAESVIAIQTAIAKAMAIGFPANIPLIGQAISQGANIVSAIKGTQPSFLGGGYTGTGARTGGVDGRGGFNAVLHPNETVVDHSRGQGGGGTVVYQTVNIYGDPSPTAVAQIKSDAVKMSVSEMANIQKRGGSPAAAVSSRR